MTDDEIVSQSAYARMKGWSQSTVSRMISRGTLPCTENRKINVREAEAALAAQHDPRYDAVRVANAVRYGRPAPDVSPEDQQPTESYASAKARREGYQAELARLEVEKAHGRLVEADAVERATYERFRVIRDRLEALPSRLAPQLATDVPTQLAIHELLEREIREVLEEVSSVP